MIVGFGLLKLLHQSLTFNTCTPFVTEKYINENIRDPALATCQSRWATMAHETSLFTLILSK